MPDDLTTPTPSPSPSAAPADAADQPAPDSAGPTPAPRPGPRPESARKAAIAEAAHRSGAKAHPGSAKAHAAAAKPAPPSPAPTASPEARERGRLLGLAAIGAAAVVAIVVTIGIFLPAIGAVMAGANAPVDAAALPATIIVCDREYDRSPSGLETLDAVTARLGEAPIVAGVKGGCPDGTCVVNGACRDVVFVRTTDDRYQQYELADTSA